MPEHHQQFLPSFRDNLDVMRTCVAHNHEVIKAMLQDAEIIFENKNNAIVNVSYVIVCKYFKIYFVKIYNVYVCMFIFIFLIGGPWNSGKVGNLFLIFPGLERILKISKISEKSEKGGLKFDLISLYAKINLID